mgnify:FL=1
MLIVMDADVTQDPQLLKGVLPVLVLALLHQQESYGYELVTRLRSHGLDSIAPGTVYPVLTRLEREGRLTSYLMASSAGPARKYYRPTPAGTSALTTGTRSWHHLTGVVSAILTDESEGAPGDDGQERHPAAREPDGARP